jgi:hypothetical protein
LRNAGKTHSQRLNGVQYKVKITAKAREKRPRKRYYGDNVKKSIIAMVFLSPYHKNDNVFVEQKSGDIVRKTAGYERFTDNNALSALNELYNLFYPNMNCIDKQQAGQKQDSSLKGGKKPCQRAAAITECGSAYLHGDAGDIAVD